MKREKSQSNQGNCCSIGSWGGESEVLKLLLQDGAQILSEDRGIAVKLAAMIPHAFMVEILLANGPIPDVWANESIYYGAVLGNPSIVQSILENVGTL